jgi:hypothetical protein
MMRETGDASDLFDINSVFAQSISLHMAPV